VRQLIHVFIAAGPVIKVLLAISVIGMLSSSVFLILVLVAAIRYSRKSAVETGNA
jgi:hypothetical protein